MYWASGQGILRAAEFIRKKPNLFGVFVTNFSCGPDSFIIERFRSTMGAKPFLTLEFDAHTADAGIDTRIEAFLDVVKGYRNMDLPGVPEEKFRFGAEEEAFARWERSWRLAPVPGLIVVGDPPVVAGAPERTAEVGQ